MPTFLYGTVFVIGIALTPIAGGAQAAVAEAACQPTPVAAEARAAAADIIFEGKITGTSCTCMPLASDEDTFGPEVACADTITPSRMIKGTVPAEIIMKKMVMLGNDPKAVLSSGDCNGKIDDRDSRLKDKDTTFYLRLVDGFYQTVPAIACR
jgi:hypothetical protein